MIPQNMSEASGKCCHCHVFLLIQVVWSTRHVFYIYSTFIHFILKRIPWSRFIPCSYKYNFEHRFYFVLKEFCFRRPLCTRRHLPWVVWVILSETRRQNAKIIQVDDIFISHLHYFQQYCSLFLSVSPSRWRAHAHTRARRVMSLGLPG